MKTAVEDVTAQLHCGEVNAPSEARPPSASGFYAWWCRRERLGDSAPVIPLEERPPVDANWSLLYVGISPSRATSTRDVGSRFTRDHVGGNIGGSTFRQSLASLLMTRLQLQPRSGADRSRLISEAPLSTWIEACCGVSFARADSPWDVEAAVIKLLNPPLNIDQGTHAFRMEVKARRSALRRACAVSV